AGGDLSCLSSSSPASKAAAKRGGMGYLLRVRLSSFAAGAATASAAGFFLIYKDLLLARAAIARQVEDIKETSGKHYEALNKRISALESRKEPGAIKEASD
ncbi:unnamed protein product, partial [Urochloa humidicola]